MTAAGAWPQAKVGDLIINIQPGFACGAHNSNGTGVPHLRPMNISTEGKIDRSVLKFVGLEFANRPEQRLRRGDVLFNNTNSPELVGKTALFTDDDEPAFSNHMTRLRPDPTRVDPEFLALMLHQTWRSGWFAVHCNNHVSQASIGRGVLEGLEISLPPLEVQRSIGALSARVSSSRGVAVQHLSSARLAIDRFRQSVLAAACSGHLTADWRAAYPGVNRSDLVATVTSPSSATTSAQSGGAPLPPAWTWASFEAATVNYDGKRIPLKSDDRKRRPGPYPYYGASGVIDHIDGYLFDGDYLLVSEDGANLLARTTPIAFQASGRFWVNNHAHVVQPREGVLADYIEIAVNAMDIQMQVTGSAQPKLTQAALNRIPIPLPPTEEQHEIVRRAQFLAHSAEVLLGRIKSASRLVDRASNAVLVAAFSTDPG